MKRMNAVHVQDQKHELTPPRDRYKRVSAAKKMQQTSCLARKIFLWHWNNPRELLYALDPEIERTQRRLRKEIKVLMGDHNGQNPVEGQNPPAPAIRQEPPAPAGRLLIPPAQQNNQQQPARTVRDYLAEDRDGLNPAVTMPEFEAEHFKLKPVMLNMLNTLGQFGGSPTEKARQHLKSFLEICNSFKIHGVSNDVLKLKLFPYSLRDKAKEWLNNFPPGSFQS
ncbi:hypothetical protein V6N13_037303 [Hibiscus sabdariffa]